MQILLTDKTGFETLLEIDEVEPFIIKNFLPESEGMVVATPEGVYKTVDDDYFVCEWCGNTGEITTMEQVYPGEPHMAAIGTRPCPHLLGSNTDDHD